MIPRLATSFRTDCARYSVTTGPLSDAQRIDRARRKVLRASTGPAIVHRATGKPVERVKAKAKRSKLAA